MMKAFILEGHHYFAGSRLAIARMIGRVFRGRQQIRHSQPTRL